MAAAKKPPGRQSRPGDQEGGPQELVDAARLARRNGRRRSLRGGRRSRPCLPGVGLAGFLLFLLTGRFAFALFAAGIVAGAAFPLAVAVAFRGILAGLPQAV